jgi:hypothetical protein
MRQGASKIVKMPKIVKVLLSPASGVFRECTEGTRNNFLALSQVLSFTVIICGFVLACSISKFGFGNNPISYFITIPIGIGFYWYIDKQIIMADANKNLAFIKRSRYFIALIFGLLNSFLIDNFWFSDDIRAGRETEITKQQLIIQHDADSLRATYQGQKNSLFNKIDVASNQMKIRMDSLITEYQGKSISKIWGPGKDYRIKYAAFKNDSLEFVRTNSLMLAEALKYDTLIDQLKIQAISRKNNVPKEISQGINHSMQLLENAIWGGGNIINMVMAILILLGAMLLELLPLMGKFYYSLEEYFELIHSERESSRVNVHLRKQNYISREAHRLNLQNQRVMNNEYANHVLQGLKDELAHNCIFRSKLSHYSAQTEPPQNFLLFAPF